MKNKVRVGRCILAVLLLLALTGCAEKGPILLNIGYQAPANTSETASKVSVGVSPFRDGRGMVSSVLGKRTIPDGQANDLVTQGTVAEIATSVLKQALVARGLKVRDVIGWDLSAEGMNTEGIDLLFGGEIKTLWLETTATSLKTHMKASIQLRIVAADPVALKIVKVFEVNSNYEQDILYSRQRLERALSEALSGAIDQVFKDDDLKKLL